MSLLAGTHTLGPDHARLAVHTRKAGAAAVAGHNLLIEVGSWSATVTLGEAAHLELTADSRSLKVLEGTGGIQSLGDDDKANISQTIDDEVLKGGAIEFRSDSVEATPGGLTVRGELNLLGSRKQITFELNVAEDGGLSGEAIIKQSDFAIKPYSALFGTLKVADEIRVEIDGRLPCS
jgi:polyisoprenoid-binding protein YceI